MKVVRLKYAHNDPLFHRARVAAIPASNLASAQLLLTGEACCGFVPVTLAARHGLPVVPRLAVYSDGPVISSRLFKGGGAGYAAVEDTTVSALALKAAMGIELQRVATLDGAFAKYAGVLVIGDDALRLVDAGRPHIADVGEVWREKFGTPLVYAVLAASPKAERQEVLRAVEELENSLAHFYENPTPLVEQAAKRLGISTQLAERYFATGVKYHVTPRVVQGLQKQAEIMGLGELNLL